MNEQKQYQTTEVRVYSRRIASKLFAQGFTPLYTLPDKRKEGYINWVFLRTPEFQKEFDNIVRASK